jgi:nucleoside-diphosphate-sugar epimerase
VSFNPRFAVQLFEVNVTGTRNVVNACFASGVKKLVHISSVAALGRTREQPFVDEHQKWMDNPLNTTYAQSKYLAELEVFRGQEEGLDCVMLNPSLILAPADWTKSSAKLFKYVWDEKKFLINNHLNYVDVRDVAYAAHRLMNDHATGHRFILNAGNISLDQFFAKIATRFGKKAPTIRVNGSVVHLLAAVEGIRSRITRSEPLITSETARLANTQFLYRNEKIKKHLQFDFKTIDQTLDWCCKYYLEHASQAQKMK